MIDTLDLALERIVAKSGEMRVSTSTLLPSGALATVTVRPTSAGSFFVTDEGAGRSDLKALGCMELTSGDTVRGNAIAGRYGLIYSEGTFLVRDVSPQQLAGAIVFVAEAAREWTSRTAEKAIRRAEAAIVDRVVSRINEIAPHLVLDRERDLRGESGKPHRFDLVASLSGDRFAVFEIVSPNSSALSSTYMKLDDLRQKRADWPREVVTRDLQTWDSADMVLLSRAATNVRDLSQSWGDLGVTLQ